ncbi:hypothetical protein D7Z96_06135 [Pseudarthrobacter phenanthrenivorans]|uniref:Fibronectin type-III domain-containing protein n=1 Tax=Pseudarthrobacter phenanthrenivorans TaxID=361575 RepID=A0A3B0FR50_PSEPS|nr:hypothetical protein [Pseudarthrobacter phenanthrenivorans]RKO25383.1 hypothetical protein D7Z96_06135 [Pseudarthrobacter phenanthrenivorans]
MHTPASSPEASPRRRRELAAYHGALQPVAFFLAVVAGALLGAPPAGASWQAPGVGHTTAAVATLLPPTNVTVPAASDSNVVVGWTPSPGNVAPTGYYVTRLTGTAAFPACGSSPAAPVPGTTCTDTAVPDGTHRYLVTAVYRSWKSAGAASAAVAVSSVRKLALSPQPPATVTAGSPLVSFRVQLRTVSGADVPESGVRVNLGLGANPAGGTLAGTTTATTDASGMATFSNLSITKSGAGYTLTASSPGYLDATTSSFTVLPAAATKLVITAGTTLAGSASASALLGPVTVERQDAYGNPVTAGSIPVSLSTSSGATGIFAATANGPAVTAVTIAAGSASASFFYGDTKAGTAAIALAAPGLAAPAGISATITAAAPARLRFDAIGPDVEKNKPITPAVTVHILDALGNQTDALAQVTLGSHCSIKGVQPVATAGSVAFPALEIAGKGTGCTLTASSGTLEPATSNVFSAY